MLVGIIPLQSTFLTKFVARVAAKRTCMSFREREMFLKWNLIGLIGTFLIISCGNKTQFAGGSNDNSPEKLSPGPLEADASRGQSSDTGSEGQDDSLAGKPGDGDKGNNDNDNPIVIGPSQSLPSTPDGTDTTNSGSSMTDVETTFQAAPYQEVSLSFDQDYMEFTHTIERESGYQPQTANFQQVTRNSYAKNMAQGTAGQAGEEVFTQNDLGIVDILVVVDNSGSMEAEHNKIKEKLPDLISQVSGASWQIRVVSTDAANPCNQFSLINENNPLDFAIHIAALGTNGSANERGVHKAIKGLDCTDDPWIRTASNLAVLIVSDEDNCSQTCGSQAENTPAELKTLMASDISNKQTLRTLGDDARVYGIYHKPGTVCASASYEADEYDSLVADTSGYAGSICDANYDMTFQTISQDMKNQLKSTFELANTPTNGSLVVTSRASENDPYLPLVQGVDYTLTGKIIEFINTPLANASVKANYLYDSVPKFSQIDLGLVPGKIEEVKITLENGDIQELGPDKYTINGTYIVFNEEPADNSQVMVSYRDSIPALLTSFPIAAAIKEGSVVAKVDGQQVSYTLTEGSVAFDMTPTDGSSIEISYEVPYIGDIINKIVTEVDSSTISELKAWDEQTGDSITITLENENFILDAGSLNDGQLVKVKYRLLGSGDLLAYELPFTPSDVSLQIMLVDSNGAMSECPVDDYSIEDKSLTLSCNIQDLSYIDISFKYLVGGIQEFATDFDNPENAKWSVLVNGTENTSFTREGSTIKLSDLPANATVVIKASYPSNPDDNEFAETAAL